MIIFDLIMDTCVKVPKFEDDIFDLNIKFDSYSNINNLTNSYQNDIKQLNNLKQKLIITKNKKYNMIIFFNEQLEKGIPTFNRVFLLNNINLLDLLIDNLNQEIEDYIMLIKFKEVLIYSKPVSCIV